MYRKVCERVNVEVANTILFFGNQILSADSNETLEDLDIASNSNITLVQRVVGGGAQSGSKLLHQKVIGHHGMPITIGSRKIDSIVRLSKQRCILMNVDDDSISKRIEMPCGHAVTPDGLAGFVNAEIKKQKTKITCPMQSCGAVWKIPEIVKRGLTAKERENLETGLAKNTLRAQGLKECLKCSAYIQRDGTGTRMTCPICKQKGINYDFCWICQNEWKNKDDFRICGNPLCDTNVEFQKVLNTCSTKDLYGVSVPLVRACPNCKKAINHKQSCKHMVCPSCNTKFCYICLSLYTNGWPCGAYNAPCKAAPRQNVM